MSVLHDLLSRCTFPSPPSTLDVAHSGGPDSTALIALATEHGCAVVAHHVDHGLHPGSAADARTAEAIARRLGAAFVHHTVRVDPGPDLEARARTARFAVLPAQVATGHTADDQAETVLHRLLRGAGSTGVAAMEPGPRHPILALRRSETHAVCRELGIDTVSDPANADPSFTRNRIRSELLPLAEQVMGRDVVPIVVRHADLARDDAALLDELAAGIDPTDARALAAAPVPLARRAIRRWLTIDGYPPDAATVERVLDVARGRAVACEIGRGRRVERRQQRFHIVPADR